MPVERSEATAMAFTPMSTSPTRAIVVPSARARRRSMRVGPGRPPRRAGPFVDVASVSPTFSMTATNAINPETESGEQ